ncbi:putative histone deacetylase [Rosa chinensis]|uniref:Putative histone deacetylase n=1 Tax=Rosa chinensis TaxID=74649 RepID=A0A2P6RBH7_ROSCH|nr:putative histone deacetylase [Rosa chinensis]
MANKMKFWGVEVKSGQSVVVEPGITLVHLSQACLDEVKKGKGSDSISLFVKTGDQKLVIGHLYADKLPQIYFDIVFNKKFVLSHNGKSGSVHFHGYIANTGYPFC